MANIFKKVRVIVHSPAFVGALILSLTLWIYTALNSEQIAYIDIPLNVKMPANRSSETVIPRHILVEFKGTGWQLINLMYFNTSAQCLLDLNNFKIVNNQIDVGRGDLIKGLQSIVNLQALNVVPESLNIKLGEITEKKVKVVPNMVINPSEGFIVVGEFQVEPDSVVIRGNDKVVRSISRWYTKPVEYENVNSSFSVTLPLVDTLKNVVELLTDFVNVNVNIQQKSSIVVSSVEVNVSGGVLPRDYVILPDLVDVTVTGGVEDVCNLNLDEIKAYIEYSSVIDDSTGIVVPRIVVPSRIKVLKIDPPFLYLVRRVNLTQLK